MKELKDMTIQELEETKKQWYFDAMEDGSIMKLTEICRHLGEKLPYNYGPKYSFKDGGKKEIEIYVDDYGNYMTVKHGDKLRVSTHNEKLYVKGEWEKLIARLWPLVESKKQEIEAAKLEKTRLELLNILT